MVEQQVHAVIVWFLDPATKAIKIHVPRIYSSKSDAVAFVKLNKVAGEQKKWEVHTTVAELASQFNFAKDIQPNYK